jgi:protein transport protein SEC24
VIDLGGAGPIRCVRCRAYINPFFSFLDGGRSFLCNLCGMVNPTPSEYFCETDENGYRRDHAERPELCRGGLALESSPPSAPPTIPSTPSHHHHHHHARAYLKSNLTSLLCRPPPHR